MCIAAPRLTGISILTPIRNHIHLMQQFKLIKTGAGLAGNTIVEYVFSIKNVNVGIMICKIQNEFYCGFNDNVINRSYYPTSTPTPTPSQTFNFILMMLVLELMLFIVKMSLFYVNMVLLMKMNNEIANGINLTIVSNFYVPVHLSRGRLFYLNAFYDDLIYILGSNKQKKT